MVMFWYTLLFETWRYGFMLAVALEPIAVRLVPPRTCARPCRLAVGTIGTR